MKLKVQTRKVIEVGDLDSLVSKTYDRRYSFQQQDGCKDGGVISLTVPSKDAYDFENDTCEEECNGPDEGVSFKAWLERDPKQPLKGQKI